MNLNCDELLSNFGLIVNLRRYTQGVEPVCTAAENAAMDTSAAPAGGVASVLAATFAAAALALL